MQQWEIALAKESDIYSHLFRGFYAAIAQLYFFLAMGLARLLKISLSLKLPLIPLLLRDLAAFIATPSLHSLLSTPLLD